MRRVATISAGGIGKTTDGRALGGRFVELNPSVLNAGCPVVHLRTIREVARWMPS